MDKNTLYIVQKLDFHQIMEEALRQNGADKRFPNQISADIVVLLALVTGIKLKTLINLRWNQILEYDNKGGPKCKSYIKVDRKYNFPISEKIHDKIINAYIDLGQPEYNNLIASNIRNKNNIETWYPIINKTISNGKNEDIILDMEAEYQNEYITQIIFGRRLFSVSGYSSKNCKFLMGLFRIKSQEELMDFLGYHSKNEIKYDLNDIVINDNREDRYNYGKPKAFLDDNKHFYNLIYNSSSQHYPFQHFQVFYDFLSKVKIGQYDYKIGGVICLLMISLTNGIRPSLLLKLKWSDLFEKGTDEGMDCFYLKETFNLDRHTLQIDFNTMKLLMNYFKHMHQNAGSILYSDKRQLTFLGEAPIIDKNCFVTNRKNALTQPSLFREIKNALLEVGFRHHEKFTTKSTLIMYGRRVIELKGDHVLTIKALKKHFSIRSTQDLFEFLYIDNAKGSNNPDIGEFSSVFEHILYDI